LGRPPLFLNPRGRETDPLGTKKGGCGMADFWTLLFRFSFGLLCHSLILCLMTDSKYSYTHTLAVWLGTFVLTSLPIAPLILFFRNVNLLFVIEAFSTLAVYCGVYLLLSKGSVWKNLFVFFTYATFFFFSLVLSSCISQMFFNGSHWATVAGRTVFLALYALWLLYRGPLTIRNSFPDYAGKGWAVLAAFSVFSGLTLYITALAFLILKVALGIRLAVAGVLFLLIGSAYLVAGHTISLVNREHEVKEAETQRKLLESQLAAEREFVAQAKASRHDLYHHINLLTDYLEREDIQGAQTYLGQYKEELNATTLEVFCENTVANALLRYTARRCGNEIPFLCRAVIPVQLSLSGPELTTVLGNTLENAWEASRGSNTPWISVTARVHRETLLVEVRNAVAGGTEFDGDLPVSGKPGGGLGLKSAARVLAKHGGFLHCEQQGNTFFTRMVILL